MGWKIELSSGGGTALPLNLDRFFKQNCQSESSRTPRPWHFGSLLPRHLRSQQVTCYLGLLSGAWMYVTWQVLELQVMSDVHRCCVMLLWSVGASSVAVGLCLAGLLPAWILGESENGCLHTLLTLFEQSKNSLHQLLMKAITKLCKKWQVCGDLWCPCVWESACVCLCGRKWGAYRWGEKKMKEQR